MQSPTAPHTAFPASVPIGMRSRLLGLDPATLSDRERIEVVDELERLKSTAAAVQARLTAAFAIGQGVSGPSRPRESATTDPSPVDPAHLRPVGSQVALARRESPSHGDEHVRLAILLTEWLPRTMTALEQGDISEWTAMLIGREAVMLDPSQRHELDERLAPDLPRLSTRAARSAARRIVAEIDAEAVRRRMQRARRGRRVSMRVLGDGMAYLSILAPMTEVAGAHASLKQHARSVLAGAVDGTSATGRDGRARGVGAIMSDTALERLTGRAPDEAQPVTVNLVMTDRSLLGWGEQSRSDEEPALIPGLGPVPASFAREQLSDPQCEAFYRRLFVSPDQRDLVAMDARARFFPAGLRLMIALRDQRCRTPYCDAPISQTDHVVPYARGGPTTSRNGMGLCQRCNLTKEAPGFDAVVRGPGGPGHDGTGHERAGPTRPRPDGPDERGPDRRERRRDGPGRHPTPRVTVDRSGTHVVEVTTPAGQRVTSVAPPVLGWGWRVPPEVEGDTWPTVDVATVGDPEVGSPLAPESESQFATQSQFATESQSATESPFERALRLSLAA